MERINIKYDAQGYPSAVYAEGAVIVIENTPPPKPTNTKVKPNDPAGDVVPAWMEEIGKTQLWVPWGHDNDLPRRVMLELEKNGVAMRALKLKAQTLYGQKLIPVKIKEIDPDTGAEVVTAVNDKEISDFLKRSNINGFRARGSLDWEVLGQYFPIFCLNEDRSEIVSLAYDKASKFRYSPFDPALGRINQMVRSANWPNPASFQLEFVSMIDSENWYYEVDRIKYDDQVKYVYPIKTMDILRDYYALATWMGVYTNGWLENSNSIPQIKKGIIKNVMSIKYHIQFSIAYWEWKYPKFGQMEQKDRDNVVNQEYTQMNDFLTGKDNQSKTFISTYGVDPSGKPLPGVTITPIDDKMKNDAWLPDATAANSEILFSIGINPAIFGLQSPGGSNLGANNGGSNIREAWLTMIAAAQMDRDLFYGWWNFVKEYNGYDPDVELRTIDKVLTTLDTGAGTAKTLS